MKAVLTILSGFLFVTPLLAQENVVTDLPEVRHPLTLTAVYDSQAKHNAFSYLGKTVPPTIRVTPGSIIGLQYVNRLPTDSHEKCAIRPCTDISNLHFHGLHVSPEKPQDDVLTMISKPGEVLKYKVDIPTYAPPGCSGTTPTRTERALDRILTACLARS
jgi:suppressor of ftsI